MVVTFARLYRWCAETHGIPYRLTESYNTPGFGYHRMAGGPATGCPCDVRLRMRGEILRRAQAGTPAPPAPPERRDPLITSGRPATGDLHIFQARGGTVFYRFRGRDGRWNPATGMAVFAPGNKTIVGLSCGLSSNEAFHVFAEFDDQSTGVTWQDRGSTSWAGGGAGQGIARFQAFAKL
jgi:hypothetical protein